MTQVAVIVGSKSDLAIVDYTLDKLDELAIAYHIEILSAHRNPDELKKFVNKCEDEGVKIFIGAAGMAAALPGAIASHTDKPVIGIPLESSGLGGLDSLLSIVQMPRGVPVATMSIGKHGAINAAIFASQVLALHDDLHPLTKKI